MSTKEAILSALGKVSPPQFGPPSIEYETIRFSDPVGVFRSSLEAAGGETVDVEGDLEEIVRSSFFHSGEMIDTISGCVTEMPETPSLTILKAQLGVAENGAVWIDPADRYPRELLTLSESLAIILSKKTIVHNMHEAYEKISFENLSYGLFMSGPSKTADIEQALVIGAHGAIRLKVFLVE